VDEIKLHVRVPAATRIETNRGDLQAVEDKSEVIPARDRDLIVDDIGCPSERTTWHSPMVRPSAPTTG
jgi:hypothetical protein